MNIGIYELLREHNKGFHILDCAVRSKDCIYIMFQNHFDENTEVLFHAGFYYPKTERVWGYDGFSDFYECRSCVLQNGPVIVVDSNGAVLSQTGETSHDTNFQIEESIPTIPNVMVLSVKNIDGKVYMAGTLRTVFRREGPNKWTCLFGNDLKVRDEEDKQGRDFGFEDIDGFAADDIYACGGDGDLWHYDGKNWQEIDCPTNKSLYAICCAGDGKVYVGGHSGILMEGRGDKWKVLLDKVPWIKRMEWFKDRLYLATKRGLYIYHNGQLTNPLGGISLLSRPESESEKRVKKLLVKAGGDKEMIDLVMTTEVSDEKIVAPSSLHTLSTDGNLLVVGGRDSVVVFDGENWKKLYSQYGVNVGGAL